MFATVSYACCSSCLCLYNFPLDCICLCCWFSGNFVSKFENTGLILFKFGNSGYQCLYIWRILRRVQIGEQWCHSLYLADKKVVYSVRQLWKASTMFRCSTHLRPYTTTWLFVRWMTFWAASPPPDSLCLPSRRLLSPPTHLSSLSPQEKVSSIYCTRVRQWHKGLIL